MIVRSVVRVALCLAVLAALPVRADEAKKPPPPPAKKAPPTATLTILYRSFRNDSGMALMALFNSEDGYPTKVEKAVRRAWLPIKDRQAKAVLAGLPPGTYAVSVIHDENNNKKLDTNWIGIPKEGTGASNDARRRFGPAKWEDARVAVPAPGRTITINIFYR